MCLHSTPDMAEPGAGIDVLLVGQTGVGKSTVINMMLGVPDDAETAAKVSNDARPCTTQTTSYSALLKTGQRCQLWDTRGLDEPVDANDRWFIPKMVDRVRQRASQQAYEALRDRTRLATPILIWCIDATKINVPTHWKQFRTVYVEYCKRKAIPAVVITRMLAKVTGWETTCRNQLRQLDLGGGSDAMDIPLLAVRKYQSTSSAEYIEDSKVLRDLIVELVRR